MKNMVESVRFTYGIISRNIIGVEMV
jgi:hypothetical protein